jgi:hypothetical protein
LALTQTFAAVDWIMSLDPGWYSTIFGVYWFAGSFVSFFALMTLMVVGLQRAGLLTEIIGLEHFHDLGKLLFAFTVFWAYIGFSQFFLIWYGNIPEETIFFRHRLEGSWKAISLLLAAGTLHHPVLLLHAADDQAEASPSRARRRVDAGDARRRHLLAVSMPLQHPHGFSISLLDVAAFLAVGGVFFAVLSRLMLGAPLVPVGDPRLPESLSFENV